MVQRVIATESADNLIERLIVKHGPADILLGEIRGSPFYISRAQYEYWKHTQLIIDVVEGRGGMFSLEGPAGLTFLTRSRPFADEELSLLANEG
ncbi:DUF779 domain-containing protein [Aromatoleum toluclasticum]|uniref:DUF779 domain-containing protein n=1 Tax=Aromatoleum toluclasticum TaxID=92003 RepID=UPI00036D7B13|nr:DUF779 domain-containing protein [Aromatoleum toluclasticum]MCC4115783.1 DUF779 domain-containing protein [Aromatoleum toluclasticum]